MQRYMYNRSIAQRFVLMIITDRSSLDRICSWVAIEHVR
jgi:hypothetical protein